MDSITAKEEFLLDLMKCIVQDFVFEGSSKDITTIERRFRNEGISFITKTLPLLHGEILAGIRSGTYSGCPNFRNKRGTSLPVFLYGAISKIFEDDGTLKEGPIDKFYTIVRQICLVVYKMRLPYDPECQTDFISDYVKRDLQLHNQKTHAPVAATALTLLFKGIDVELERGRFGPGATSDGRTNCEKFNYQLNFPRLDTIFPTSWVFPNLSDKIGQESSRMILVPKDSRGPRVISCEPPEYMFYQQMIARTMMARLASNKAIEFIDQSKNRVLARLASIDQSYATIDMKEASDRISTRLVESLFGRTALLHPLLASRTRFCELPDGRTHYLLKFANMGSATCFPVEACVFWALLQEYNARYGKKYEHHIFGDDIITTESNVDRLAAFFCEYGMELNIKKSFSNCRFRESCGGVYLDGVDVAHVKLNDVDRASIIAFANHCFDNGMYKTAERMRKWMPAPSGYDTPYTYKFGEKRGRTRVKNFVVQVLARVPVTRTTHLSPEGALFRALSGLGAQYERPSVMRVAQRKLGTLVYAKRWVST